MQEHLSGVGAEERPVPGLFRDVDELNHAISGSELEVMRLESGDLEVQALSFDIDGLSVDRGRTNRRLRVRGGLDAGRYSLGIFHPNARARFNGMVIAPAKLLFMSPGEELDGHICESYGWTSLVIPPAWIDAISRVARRPGFLDAHPGCRTVLPDAGKLQDLFLATEALVAGRLHLAANEEGEQQLCLDVRNALGAVLSDFDAPDHKAESGVLSQYRTAQRAERYMRERDSEDISIDELCEGLLISRRYLEYAFRNAYGTSPSRYFRLLRLHHVRRRLRRVRNATTVTTEALNHGFTHLGWFSTQYRALFGESPSSTLYHRANRDD